MRKTQESITLQKKHEIVSFLDANKVSKAKLGSMAGMSRQAIHSFLTSQGKSAGIEVLHAFEELKKIYEKK